VKPTILEPNLMRMLFLERWPLGTLRKDKTLFIADLGN